MAKLVLPCLILNIFVITNCVIYDLISIDKTISHAAYQTANGYYQQCISICSLSPQCFSFDYAQAPGKEDNIKLGECRFYDVTHVRPNGSLNTLMANEGVRYYSTFPENCVDWYHVGERKNGVYQVLLLGHFRRKVYCWMEDQDYGPGWMAFQRRFDGSIKFFGRSWEEFKKGFGNESGEYYLGNEMLHQLTTQQKHDYLVVATSGASPSKLIQNVRINSEWDSYRIVYKNEDVDFVKSSIEYEHKMINRPFSTFDRENNINANHDCAAEFGAWWHLGCHSVAMNGLYRPASNYTGAHVYANGIIWEKFKGYKDFDESLKTSLLMIRPSKFKV